MPRLAAHVCALLLAATLGGSAGFSNPNLRGDSIKCVNEGQLTHVPGISDDPCITCKCQNSVVQCGRETCPLPRGCYFLQQAKGNKCCDVCKGCVYNGRVYSSSEEWTDPHDPCRRFLCQSGVITESRIYCHINCKNPRPPPDGQCCPYCDGCLVNGRQYLEGDAVPSDERDPCVVCTCKDGRVTCTKKSCPVLPCPYNRIAQTPETCCPECRGGKRSDYLNGKCLIGQEVFDHAATWPYDQCTNCECQNGTTVCQRTVCPPLQCPPEHQVASAGSCCSECRRPEEKKAMCYYNNQKYYNGDTWKLKKCTKCSCHHGVVRCGVEECITAPVCPPKKKLVTPPGKCCPTCVEEDGICTVFGDPHYKTFDGKIFNYQGPCRYVLASDCSGGTFSIEVWNDVRYSKSFSWTKSVVIRNGTTVCQRTVCPPLQCPPEHQVASAGSCCSECRRPEEKKAMCYYNNQKYYNGDTWKLKKCTKCSCHHGVVRCGVEECITAPVCPPKKKLVTPPGKCCPTCVEEDGICTVFGDPHYKTFDGKIFNYQGPCRYVLASDCSGGTFSIEVWNDVRYSKSFSWTKSVVIRVKDMKVKLGQFLRVRIKKERIKLPFVKLRVLNILQEDHNIVVRINKGVKVVWDGDNYVEVSVSPTYKGKLCGLCGNYNDKQDDDFMSRNGTRLTDPNAFGNSWLVGRRKKCLRPPKRPSHPLDCRLKDWSLRLQNLQNCNNIKQGSFKLCHKAVEATPYFRSCMLDMCECLPSDKCYCDSLNAYARECSRAGIQIDWKNSTNCQGMHCPRSSYYTTCGPPCRRTCKNYQQARPCRRKCQPGCQCNPGRVWHRDRCVLPSECPLPTS
ncbi:BMP-binding endothelial regulator protein [Ixodes scapularis]